MVLHQEEGYLQRLYLRQVYHPEQMLQVLHIHLMSNANANNDASYTYAYIGSRLAFRGKLVRAQSVAAYKAIREVA